MTFNERVKKTLKAKDMKQVDLARATGLSTGQVAFIVNGRTKSPTLSTAAKVADALDVSLDYLAGRTDNPSGMTANEVLEMQIDAEARALLRGFELLPPEGKTAIQDQVDFQLSKSRNNSAPERLDPAYEVA